jgi:hypothetical protein
VVPAASYISSYKVKPLSIVTEGTEGKKCSMLENDSCRNQIYMHYKKCMTSAGQKCIGE